MKAVATIRPDPANKAAISPFRRISRRDPEQLLLHCRGDGGPARARQAGEPQNAHWVAERLIHLTEAPQLGWLAQWARCPLHPLSAASFQSQSGTCSQDAD